MVKNPSANAGDKGSIPDLRRSHMPQRVVGNWQRKQVLMHLVIIVTMLSAQVGCQVLIQQEVHGNQAFTIFLKAKGRKTERIPLSLTIISERE